MPMMCLLIYSLLDRSRYAGNHTVFRYILCHNTSGSDYTARPDGDALHNGNISTKPAIISNHNEKEK